MNGPVPEAAFLGIAHVEGAAAHHRYNEWHQMDHRPENLLLEGVSWGERWVRSPDCLNAGRVARGAWADFHYLNSYWFRSPANTSIAQWAALADRSVHWGRRPDIAIAQRPFMSFFRPVLGLAAPRVLVSPAALPFRPNRGIHLTVISPSRAAAADRAGMEKRFAWYSSVGFPSLIERRGVAGVWAFASAPDLIPPTWAHRESATDSENSQPQLRVHMVFCDEDPVEVAGDIQSDEIAGRLLVPDDVDFEDVIFCGPLRAIEPWRWDWFGDPAEKPT